MTFLKDNFRNIAAGIILFFLYILCILYTHEKGLIIGKRVGWCEFACKSTGGEFIAVVSKNECQCQSTGRIPWIYSVDIEQKDE